MLPSVVPRARIIVYSYDSAWHANAPRTRLALCGEHLLQSLHDFRDGVTSRPVILLGHSLGGNIVQHACLFAHSDVRYKYLILNTVGLIFLGTPFRGSKLQRFAWLCAQLLHPAGSHSGIIDDLSYDAPVLTQSLQQFCRLRNETSIPVLCCFELYETNYGRRFLLSGIAKGMVVEEASACISGCDHLQLQTDHIKMNKFSGPTDRSFIDLSGKIKIMCDNPAQLSRYARPLGSANKANPNHYNIPPSIGSEDSSQFTSEDARRCLRELLWTDPAEDLGMMKRKKGARAKNTCEWFLDTNEIRSWLNYVNRESSSETRDHRLLWLHGLPGTGKSSISMYLAEALPSVLAQKPGQILAYFFCDSDIPARRSAIGILRGLIYQLLKQSPPLFGYIMPLFLERESKLFDSFDALWKIFVKMVDDENTGSKYLVIDALDECESESQQVLLQQIKQTLAETSTSGGNGLRLLITSRPYPEIKEELQPLPNRDLASFPQSMKDVEIFVEEKLAMLQQKKGYSNEMVAEIKEVLKRKAEGTFLWIGLACEDLEKIAAKDAFEHLSHLPKGLSSLYARLLDSAFKTENNKATITRILKFVAIAIRPLTTSELSAICDIAGSDNDNTRAVFVRDWIGLCRLLVVMQDDKVLLLHKSVKDFLVSYDTHGLDIAQSHADLAYRCIDLMTPLLKKSPKLEPSDAIHLSHRRKDVVFSRNPVVDEIMRLAYGIEFWPMHAGKAQQAFTIRSSDYELLSVQSKPASYWAKLHALIVSRRWHDTNTIELEILYRIGIQRVATRDILVATRRIVSDIM